MPPENDQKIQNFQLLPIGKGCIKKPIEFIMEDIRQRDLPNRQREAEWKQMSFAMKSWASTTRPSPTRSPESAEPVA